MLLNGGVSLLSGIAHFPKFNRTLSVSSKVHAGTEYTDRGSITEILLCMPGLHRIKFMDTHQVREYPNGG